MLLLPLSPKMLSGDSSEYLRSAITGENLVHPHHLTYSLLLRGLVKIGDVAGLGGVPYWSLRLGMLLIGMIGIWATFGALRALRIRNTIAASCSAIVAFSGLYWQFTSQFEAYVPAYVALVLASWATAAQATRIAGGASRFGILLPAGLLAFATTLHQVCALAAPAIALLFWVQWRRDSRNRTGLAYAVILLVLAGAISLGAYIAGWWFSRPGVSFGFWMTKYAHWSGMPWGLASNFSVLGVKQLVLSWGATWLNLEPHEFYRGVPPSNGIWLAAVGAMVGFTLLLLLAKSRRVLLASNAWWIVLWLLPMELFTLWWTPFLKNFQAPALFPQIAILAVSLELIASGQLPWLRNTASRLARASAIGIALTVLAVVLTVNGAKLAVGGLKDRLSPEGSLLLIKTQLRPGDILITEWPDYNMARALIGFENAHPVAIVQQKNLLPDWHDPSNRGRHVFVGAGTVFLTNTELDRSGRKYEMVWGKLFEDLVRSAGGREKLRASILTNGNELLGIAFGVDDTLPMNLTQACLQIASLSEFRSLEAYGEIDEFFLSKVPPEELKAEHRKAIAAAPPAVPYLAIPMLNADGKPAWNGIFDTDSVTPDNGALRMHSRGTDPVIWRALSPPQDMSAYSVLQIDASFDTSAAKASNPDDFHIQVFFDYENEPLSELKSVRATWPTDGSRATQTIDLTRQSFWRRPRRIEGLRVDIGAIPNSTVRLFELSFATGSAGSETSATLPNQ